ncbi:MAG: adenylosuccinate lyase [Acidobacteria bacterium]|nr:adenylosuccinate lyase [Acidobacteriota bacterium]
MIERYSREEIKSIWSDENRIRKWLDVELASTRALEARGVVPGGTAEAISSGAKVDISRMLEIEEVTHHDVIAFTQMISEQVGDAGRWLHYGLTSSDVVDTALCILVRDSLELIIKDFELLADAVKEQAFQYKLQPMMGRTHGVHAEPTTFGLKLALWYAEVLRDLERLQKAKENISVGKLSGAVGTYAHLPQEVEEHVCHQLGLEPDVVSSQIIQRDRHAEVMTTLAICAGTLEKFATEIRHLQRTEVREVEEPFRKGQKGSSTMPHKRNPVKCENVTGLARLVRSYSNAALENIALWHERDISHSSVERVIFPDAFILLDFITDRFTKIVKGLHVYPEAMEKNLNLMKGMVFSGKVLLRLVESGISREDAYTIVQENAMKVWEGEGSLQELLLKDERVNSRVKKEALEAAFSMDDVYRSVEEIFMRVFKQED